MEEIKQLSMISSKNLLELCSLNLIKVRDLNKYIRKDGKISLDPSVLYDLQKPYFQSAWSGLYPSIPSKPPELDLDKAQSFVIELYNANLITKPDISEYFGLS